MGANRNGNCLDLEWVLPAQSWETAKIGVGGAKFSSVLDSQGCKMGIGCQISSCAKWFEEPPQNIEVPLCWMNDDRIRLGEPLFHDLECIGGFEWICEKLAARCEPHKRKKHNPGKSDWFCSGKRVFQPGFGPFVMR